MSGRTRAGAARTVITPPLGTSLAGSFDERKAGEVHDDLYAHALVLESGGTRVALVSLDLIVLRDAQVAAARARIAARTGIPPSHVLIACTHTHSGPATAGLLGVDADEEYIAWLPARVADAVEIAAARLRPAVLGGTSGSEERLTFNRRFHMRDGTVRMNPGVGNPDIVSPAGPIDPQIGLVYVAGAEGTPLAVVVNFALHYIDLDSPTEISAGYFGELAALLRRVYGAEFETIYLNGACGDINNIDVHAPAGRRQGGHVHAARVAGVMAGNVLRQIALLDLGEADLAAARVPLALERKPITPDDLRTARRILEGGEIPAAGPFSWVRGMAIPAAQAPIYARECLLLAEMPPVLESEVQALRLGETGIAALPGEIFVEIGLDIKAASPLPHTMVATLANGYVGYLCTDRALREGSYETWAARSSLPAAGSEGRLRAAAGAALDAVATGRGGDPEQMIGREEERPMATEPIRLALIGCGGIAKGHIAAYKALAAQCRLVYCVDTDAEKARAFAADAGCRWTTDYASVLDEIDAVDIATPPHLHAPMAVAAARRGKHVLTEKVMAITLAQADEMIRVSEEQRVKLMVAYVTRYDPIWIRLHEAVEAGVAGRPYFVTCRTEHAPHLASWRASWDTFPMGALLSHGCHYVDQMIWHFGDVAAATSVGTNTVRGPGLAREDTAAMVMRFQNGMLGTMICSWAARHTNLYIEFNVYGTDGFLRLTYAPDGARRLEFYAGGRQAEVLYEHDPRKPGVADEPKNFVGECAHFIDCIVHDREPLTNGRESRKSMAAILAAYQGDDENRIVWLEPGGQYAARPGTISAPHAGS